MCVGIRVHVRVHSSPPLAISYVHSYFYICSVTASGNINSFNAVDFNGDGHTDILVSTA